MAEKTDEEKTDETKKSGGGNRRGVGRKFAALLICLAAVCVCAWLKVDVTMSVVGLYALYVGGNVSQKVGMDFAENIGGRISRSRAEFYEKTDVEGGR